VPTSIKLPALPASLFLTLQALLFSCTDPYILPYLVPRKDLPSIKMGAAISSIANALDNSKEKEAQAKEQLELMMKLADARLDTFEAELKTMFLDKESAKKTSVPGHRALRFERHVQVDTESTVRRSAFWDRCLVLVIRS
jgi:hypothetical protein